MLNEILLSFFLSAIVSWFTVPAIIKIAFQKRLVDDPTFEDRKIHNHSIPNLGGVAVFSSFALVSSLLIRSEMLPNANFIFAAALLIFCIGLKDDLIALDPYKKFTAQFITSFIVVYLADIRFTSFYGVFGMQEISPELSYIFTSFFVVFIINAFNLIDGINGLLGSLAIFISLTFGILFFSMGQPGWAVLSFSLAGALVGFLRFNLIKRARIFMGDGGAYTIGFILALLSISFVEINKQQAVPSYESAPAIVLAIMIIPIFDTLRVFAKRIISGKSPFYPDRNHLHHRFLNMGFSHQQTTLTLLFSSFGFATLAFALRSIGTVELMLLVLFTAQFINYSLWLYDSRMQLILYNNKLAAEAANQSNEIILGTALDKIAEEGPSSYTPTAKENITQELLRELDKRKN